LIDWLPVMVNKDFHNRQ